MQKRRLGLSILCFSALMSSQAYTLGMGEVELDSHLGYPLRAVIPVTHLNGLDSDQMKVTLGSEQEYARMGVEREYLHSTLVIDTVVEEGRGYIRITTRNPVSEPFLNFVLALRWPEGRIAKEFTLLLDPPIQSAIASSALSTQTSRLNVTPSESVQKSAASLALRNTISSAPNVTQRGDTLWGVAERLRNDSSISIYRMMNALVAANPRAFVNGDPATLKEAVEMSLPTPQQLELARNQLPQKGLSPLREELAQEAPVSTTVVNDVVSDGEVEPVSEAETESLPQSAPVPMPASTERPASLELVVPGASSDTADTSLDAVQSEEQQLRQRITQVNQQVENLNQSMEGSRERLSGMQQQLSMLVERYQREVGSKELPSLEEIEAQRRSAGVSDQTAAVAESRAAQSSGGSWWVNISYLLLLAGLVWLALRNWLRSRRAKSVPLRRHSAESFGVAPLSDIAELSDEDDSAQDELLAVTSTLHRRDSKSNAQDARAAVLKSVEPQRNISDPIVSSGAYLAFGRTQEAEQVLRKGVEEFPARSDIKLKLLELYKREGDQASFKACLSEWDVSNNPELAEQLKSLREG